MNSWQNCGQLKSGAMWKEKLTSDWRVDFATRMNRDAVAGALPGRNISRPRLVSCTFWRRFSASSGHRRPARTQSAGNREA